MLTIAVFDASDADGSLLAPLTDLRPVFDVRTGALTTLERLTLRARQGDLPAPDALLVPEPLAALATERHRLPVNDHARHSASVLLVNGAAPMADTDATGVEHNEALVDAATGALLKAHVPSGRVRAVLAGDRQGLTIKLAPAAPAGGPPAVLSRPWHVRAWRDECLALDLRLLAAAHPDALEGGRALQRAVTGGHPLAAAPSATVHPSAIIDTSAGPVHIAGHATVRAGAILVGPAFVGEHSTVLERTLVKAGTAVGPHCKAAGEVGGTIFQGFANKAHDGHLGDAWIGEWVNLGAGTTNSNLLNTYAEVIARPLGPAGRPASSERTGQQFLGCVLGDHVKTAICTRIMTGAIAGTGTMFAATAPLSGTLPAFSWVTDASPDPRPFRFDKFLEVATAAMARRKLTPSPAYVERLRALSSARS